MLMIAAGYEDDYDADALRHYSMFKLTMGRPPDDGALCSQPTISRLKNLPDKRTPAVHGLRHGRFLLRQLPPRAASCHRVANPSAPVSKLDHQRCGHGSTIGGYG
jgi:hypothetical protein